MNKYVCWNKHIKFMLRKMSISCMQGIKLNPPYGFREQDSKIFK